MFCSFGILVLPFIWPKSLYKHSITRSHRSSKKTPSAVVISIVTSSMTFLYFYISRWWRQTWDTCINFTFVSQSGARVSTEHGIKYGMLYLSKSHTTHVQLWNALWRYDSKRQTHISSYNLGINISIHLRAITLINNENIIKHWIKVLRLLCFTMI